MNSPVQMKCDATMHGAGKTQEFQEDERVESFNSQARLSRRVHLETCVGATETTEIPYGLLGHW